MVDNNQVILDLVHRIEKLEKNRSKMPKFASQVTELIDFAQQISQQIVQQDQQFNTKIEALNQLINDKYEQLDTKLNLIDSNNKKDKDKITKQIHDNCGVFASQLQTLTINGNRDIQAINDKFGSLNQMTQQYEQLNMKLNLIDINSKKDKEELHKLIDKTHKESALDINTLKNDTNTALSNFNNKLKQLIGLHDKYEQVAVKLDIIDINSKKDKEELNKLIHDKHVDFANQLTIIQTSMNQNLYKKLQNLSGIPQYTYNLQETLIKKTISNGNGQVIYQETYDSQSSVSKIEIHKYNDNGILQYSRFSQSPCQVILNCSTRQSTLKFGYTQNTEANTKLYINGTIQHLSPFTFNDYTLIYNINGNCQHIKVYDIISGRCRDPYVYIFDNNNQSVDCIVTGKWYPNHREQNQYELTVMKFSVNPIGTPEINIIYEHYDQTGRQFLYKATHSNNEAGPVLTKIPIDPQDQHLSFVDQYHCQ